MDAFDVNSHLQEYDSSLSELRLNSKPLISVLTMLAEENLNAYDDNAIVTDDRLSFAEGVVRLIEKRIYEVPSSQKLCFLYLIDSICKNLKGKGKKIYIELFSRNLVKIFRHIFENVDEKIRISLWKTRLTWPSVFPESIIHQIDSEIHHKLDHNWPLSKKDNQLKEEKPKIAVNPVFVSMNKESSQPNEVTNSTAANLMPTNSTVNRPDTRAILEQLNTKKRILAGQRSKSPDRKRSPNWNSNNNPANSTANNFANLNNPSLSNLPDLSKFPNLPNTFNNQIDKNFNLNNNQIGYPNQLSLSNQVPSISDFNKLNNLNNLNSLSDLSSKLLDLSSIQPLSVHNNQPINSIPGLNIPSNNTPNSLLQSNLQALSLPSTSIPPVSNHQLSNLNNMNNVNNFADLSNLIQPKDIDYRLNQQQPFMDNSSVFNLLNNPSIQNQQPNLFNQPEDSKLVVDGKIRKLFYLDDHSAIVLNNCLPDLPFDKLRLIRPTDLDPRSIRFEGPPVDVYIDDIVINLPFDNQWKIFYKNNCEQRIKFGGPTREIYLNSHIYRAKFGGDAITCKLLGDMNDHALRLGLPAPTVKLSDQQCVDLWLFLLQKYPLPPVTQQASVIPSIQQPSLNNLTNYNFNNALNLTEFHNQLYQQQPSISALTMPLMQPQQPAITQPFSSFYVPTVPLMVKDQISVQQQQNGKHADEPTTKINHRKEEKFKRNKKEKHVIPVEEKQTEPALVLESASLKIKRQSLIDSLYSGAQCTNCSRRFDNKTEKGKSKYSAHLDWHFRQNRKIRDNSFKTLSLNRDWYLPDELWLKYKEINMEEENDNGQTAIIFDLNNQQTNDDQKEQAQIPLISANEDDSLNVCSICYEKFNQRWCDDEEEWKLENAVVNDEGKYYHPTCLTDHLNKSLNEEDMSIKGEETILRISESILENYDPSDVNEDDKLTNDDLNLEEKENKIETDLNIDSIKLEREDLEKMEQDESAISKTNETNTVDTDSLVDKSNLVKKTVLNIVDDQETSNKLENIKIKEELKVEKSDVIVKKENDVANELEGENSNGKVEQTIDQPVKIELKQNNKKDSKPILLKLNMKESNLDVVSLNQRKQNERDLNSPKSDDSKSPVRDPKTEYNYQTDPNVVIKGREESALCSIM